jgi:hypothetical protein
MRASIWIGAIAIFGLACAISAAAQGMMQHVDLASPEMASAEMTRADKIGRVCIVRNVEVKDGAVFSIEEKRLTDCRR